jgi:hypothetical protein
MTTLGQGRNKLITLFRIAMGITFRPAQFQAYLHQRHLILQNASTPHRQLHCLVHEYDSKSRHT